MNKSYSPPTGIWEKVNGKTASKQTKVDTIWL